MLSLIQEKIFQQQAQAIALPSDIELLKANDLRELHRIILLSCDELITNQNVFAQIQCTTALTLILNQNQFKYIIYCRVPKYDVNNQELILLPLLEILFENIFEQISIQKIKSILIPVLGCDNADFSIHDFLNAFETTYKQQREQFKDVKFILVSQSSSEYEVIKSFIDNQNPITPNHINTEIYIPHGNQTSLTQKFLQFTQQNNQNYIEVQKSNFSDKSDSEIAQYRREYNNANNSKQQQDYQYLGYSHNQESLNQKINQFTINNSNDKTKQQQQQQQQQQDKLLIKSAPLVQSNKIFLSLFIEIDNIILEQKDIIKFMLQVCYDLNKLHYKLIQNAENLKQSNQVFNYKIYYKQSVNLQELQPFCPPEISKYQQISETHDSYSLGVLFKLILQKINQQLNQEDLQEISQIQQLLDKLVSQTIERPQIDDIFSFLLSLQLNESLIEDWTQVQKGINYFYRKRGILQKIQDIKKQMLLEQDSNSQHNSLVNFNNLQTENQFLNKQSDQYDPNQSLFNQLQQIQFKEDCEYAQRKQNYKFCNTDCVVIPANKSQFKQSLPNYIKLDSKLDKVLDKIINLAQIDKEHYLQSIRSYVPIFGCNFVLFVFCPNHDQTVGRQIQLTNCFRDMYDFVHLLRLLYSLKCLKINTFCLCLDEISRKLIINKNDISMDMLAKAFDDACNKSSNPVIWNKIQFNNQEWIVVKKIPMKFKLLEQQVIIHNQDIIQIKGIDAIVNATDHNISNQGGLCGSIFQAAGEIQLKQEIQMVLQKLGRKQLEPSEVVVTKSYNLGQENGPKYIFHVVGPIYNPQDPQQSTEQLSKCLINILQKCQEYQISSIAIPPISARNCDFPKYKCAQIFYSTFLNFKFKYPISIHLVDVVDKIVEIFQIIFKGEKLREIIHSKIDFAPPTDCLVGPIDINNYNSDVLKRIIGLAGPSFQNELEDKIKNYQIEGYCQSILIQGHKMKFNNFQQILLISKPLNIIDKQTLLYKVFFSIFVETFLKKKFTSITILLYSILQQCLTNQEDLKRYDGKQIIYLLLNVIQDYQNKYGQECGKITILSNVAQFCTECELIFK